MPEALLALDGEAITLKDMKLSLSMKFQDKDQSGSTSDTTRAEQGMKGKEVKVSGTVPFRDIHLVRRLFSMACTTGSGGSLKVWRIASALTRSVGVHQVTFSGDVSVAEQGGKMAWEVSFTLREKLSVPERRQARSRSGTAAKQVPGGGTARAGAAPGGAAGAGEEDAALSGVEKVMKMIDDRLGMLTGGENATAKNTSSGG